MVFTTGRHWWILGSGRSSWQLGIEIWGEAGDSLFLLHFEICKILHPYLDPTFGSFGLLTKIKEEPLDDLLFHLFFEQFDTWSTWKLLGDVTSWGWTNDKAGWHVSHDVQLHWTLYLAFEQMSPRGGNGSLFFWRGGRGRNAWNARFCIAKSDTLALSCDFPNVWGMVCEANLHFGCTCPVGQPARRAA